MKMAKTKNTTKDIPLSLFMELPIRNDIIKVETDDPLSESDCNIFTLDFEQNQINTMSNEPDETRSLEKKKTQFEGHQIESVRLQSRNYIRKKRKAYLNPRISKISNNSKSFKCPDCEKRFRSSNNLNSHIKAVHLPKNLSNKVSLCHFCGKVFNYVSQYHEHLRLHENIRNFECPICKKAFASKRILTIHGKIHDSIENRKFICGHIFEDDKPIKIITNAPSLQYLTTNSSGQKVCNFACVSKSDLRKHMLIHSNIKPYTCHLCSMSFRQTGHLRRHIKRHSGKRDFVCNVCSMGFVTKDNLNNHLTIHEKVLPYICEHCGKTLLQRSQCIRHVAKCSVSQMDLVMKSSQNENDNSLMNTKDQNT